MTAGTRGSNSSSGGSSSSDSGSSTSRAAHKASSATCAVSYAEALLTSHDRACSLLDPAAEPCHSLLVALPAGPAAARLGLAMLRACSRQQLWVAGAIMDGVLRAVYCYTLVTSAVLEIEEATDTVDRLPGTRELRLSPDLAPCLAISSLVALLQVPLYDRATRSEAAASSTSGSKAAAGSTPGSSSSWVGFSTTNDVQHKKLGSGHSSAAAAARQPACSLASVGGSSLGSSKPGRQESCVSLASLTPLAASLFDLLGVDRGTVMRTVNVVGLAGNASSCVECCRGMLSLYFDVLAYQVRWLCAHTCCRQAPGT